MGYERILTDAINAELDRLQSEGRPMIAAWITQAICQQHEGALTGDEDGAFWRHTGYSYTRNAVRQRINARAGDRSEMEARSPRLPGYDHLQQYYIVTRRGHGEVGIPIYDLTDREIDAKIILYETMSQSCFHHAEELRVFKSKRKSERRKKRV